MMKKILTTLFAFIIIISSLNFSFGEGVTGVYGWTKHISAGERWWTYIDSSADGTKLVALLDQIFYNYIYTSVDGGKTWATSTSAGEKWWSSVTSSADGTKLAATGNYRDWDISEDFNYVYTSEDSGVTWATSTSAGNRDWSSITYSSDGTKLIAAVDGGYIYISNDSGATWATSTEAGERPWSSLTSSSDGTNLAAIDSYYDHNIQGYVSNIHFSTTSGATWATSTFPEGQQLMRITSSSDGAKLAATVYDGYIYTSDDFGATWTERTSAGKRAWRSITSSNDGEILAAALNSGYIYTSADSGVTWTPETSLGINYWNSIVSSSDGTKFVVASNNTNNQDGYIYTYSSTVFKPTVISSVASITSSTSIIFNGYVNTSHTTHGVEYCTTGSSNASCNFDTDSNVQKVEESGEYTLGDIAFTVDNVTPNSFLHYRFYAENSEGRSYSDVQTILFEYKEWVEQTSSKEGSWASVTSSSEGKYLAATPMYGYIYTSANYGETWSVASSSNERNWQSIISSDDGKYLVAAAAYGGFIYTSDDFGVTWTERTSAGNREWAGITSSSNGEKIAAAAAYGGFIYTSDDWGETWVERVSSNPDGYGSRGWAAITSSNNGEKLAAVNSWGGFIYTSSDSGATWTEQTNSNRRSWSSITSSADGTKLAATVNGGYIYTSTDSGLTWTEQQGAGSRRWSSIVSSADGTKLAATDAGAYPDYGYIYVSSDSGKIWTPQTSAGQKDWASITSSADGSKLIAVDSFRSFIQSYYNALPMTEDTKIFSDSNKIGSTFIGEYTYYDAEGDLEYGSTYQWYRDDTIIPGAENINYTLTEEDVNATLVFEVTPRSLTGISPGEKSKSEGVLVAKDRSGGLLPLPKEVPPSIPVITYVSTSTATSSESLAASSTATTTIVTPTTPKTGIVSGNGSYVSPLDQKTYTCNADSKPFNSFMRLNSKNNDVNQVKLWQAFLNADLGLNIPITGFFGQQTFEATKAFQKKYASEILTPWDIQDATGYFYKSTQYKANNLLSCSGMTLTLDNGVVLNY